MIGACERSICRLSVSTRLPVSAKVPSKVASHVMMLQTQHLQLTSSSERPFLGGSLRYSSASPNTRFMCLSNAMNLRGGTRSLVGVVRHGHEAHR